MRGFSNKCQHGGALEQYKSTTENRGTYWISNFIMALRSSLGKRIIRIKARKFFQAMDLSSNDSSDIKVHQKALFNGI